MDAQVKSSMLEYYDAQAPVYDRVYSGQFADAARLGAEVYVADTAALRDVVGRSSRGSLLDAPCGTAFWLPSYAPQVARTVLIDQSAQMLEQARRGPRVAASPRCARSCRAT